MGVLIEEFGRCINSLWEGCTLLSLLSYDLGMVGRTRSLWILV